MNCVKADVKELDVRVRGLTDTMHQKEQAAKEQVLTLFRCFAPLCDVVICSLVGLIPLPLLVSAYSSLSVFVCFLCFYLRPLKLLICRR